MRCVKGKDKVNTGKNKVMVLNREEGIDWEVYVDGIYLEYVSKFKYLGYVLDESGTDGAECSRKVASGRRVASAIRSLVNDKDLQLKYARVLHETLRMPVLMYGSKTLLWTTSEDCWVLGRWIGSQMHR